MKKPSKYEDELFKKHFGISWKKFLKNKSVQKVIKKAEKEINKNYDKILYGKQN